ncbi:MAG: lipid A biosynthesis acyltransferase [Chitinophagia bacterium]|nr:lipid A biosynthesis acyltransferase [Chitinophagia bacterium]
MIATPFIFLLSILPFPVLYGLSYVVYVLLFYVLGYRKKVVFTNLRNAFPEKSEAQIKSIGRHFYRYLCDLFLETFKTLTISRESMLRHCSMTPSAKQLMQAYHTAGQSVILVLGHWGNWEWAGNTFSMECPQQLYVIYHPITNTFFDDLMRQMRTRFGSKLIAMKNTFREMLAMKGEVTATAFIADQTPSSQNAYWTTFLNQDTPVFRGTEIIAKKLNLPVIYISVKKVRRGYYEMDAELLHNNPVATAEGEITEMHTRRLEKDIIAHPEYWLWSHRRWKHKRPEA